RPAAGAARVRAVSHRACAPGHPGACRRRARGRSRGRRVDREDDPRGPPRRRPGHARHDGAGGALTRAFAGAAPPAEGFPRPRSAPSPAHLAQPATGRKALGQALAALRPRPVVTVDDLLEHTPFRYEDYRSERTLASIAPGEEATVTCTVERIRVRPTRRRNLVIVEAAVRDESGPGVVIWFNQRYLARELKPSMRL